jgi:hypothetical protein
MNFSDISGPNNAHFNRNFKKIYKLIEPLILDIVAKKIVEKFGSVSSLFSDSF